MSDERRPRHKAVALRYDEERASTPRVVARGSGAVADQIVEIAERHGVAMHEDPDLVEALSLVDVDAAIPEELFVAVAEVLAFVYRLDERLAPRGRKDPHEAS